MTKVLREMVREALSELASEEEQRRLWCATGGDEVSSLDECVSRLFDDSGLADALDGPAVVVTDAIDERLRALQSVLASIDGSRGPEEILRDPRLRLVRSLAQDLADELRDAP